MNSDTYAQALIDLMKEASASEAEAYLTNFKKLLEKRGHMSLLPQIVTALERKTRERAARGAALSVARKADIETFKEEILTAAKEMGLAGQTLSPKIDEALVGGFRIESEDKLHDASYKRSLIDMYRELIN